MCYVDTAERSSGVGWLIVDVDWQRRRLKCSSWPDSLVLCSPDTDGPWQPACTPRVQERWASEGRFQDAFVKCPLRITYYVTYLTVREITMRSMKQTDGVSAVEFHGWLLSCFCRVYFSFYFVIVPNGNTFKNCIIIINLYRLFTGGLSARCWCINSSVCLSVCLSICHIMTLLN